MPGYKIWFLHGETDYVRTSKPQTTNSLDEPSTDMNYGVCTIQMVKDTYSKNLPSMVKEEDRR